MPENSVEIISMSNPESIVAEAFRTLRTNIMLREFDKPMQVINVTSANAQEGKTTTAINLAAVYGQLGKRTILIDMDLRLPTVHKKLGMKNMRGLTDIITGKSAREKTIFTYKDTFDVLLSGTKMPFTSEFIQSEALKSFIEDLRTKYDVIILDCPPVNLVTDGLIASSYCDGTLLCVASDFDEKSELLKAKESLETVSANVIGVVMTKVDNVGKKYKYDYGYGYTSTRRRTKTKGR